MQDLEIRKIGFVNDPIGNDARVVQAIGSERAGFYDDINEGRDSPRSRLISQAQERSGTQAKSIVSRLEGVEGGRACLAILSASS